MTVSFGARLSATIHRWGRLCVGIDPHPHLLDLWGLPDDARGAREFGLRVIDAAAGRIGIVKPQVAFFERFASTGYAALEDVLSAARAADLLVIADVKRGDVGTSVEAYARAWLAFDSPLEADAVTVSPYLGVGALTSSAAMARANGKGLFVLAATSNPEAAELQTAILASGIHRGMTVAAGIVADVRRLNQTSVPGPDETATSTPDIGLGDIGFGDIGLGDIGVVIGATVRMEDVGIDPSAIATSPSTPILAPGFGHQGARLDRLTELFGDAASSVVASVSRSVLSAGRSGIGDAISRHAHAVAGSSVRS